MCHCHLFYPLCLYMYCMYDHSISVINTEFLSCLCVIGIGINLLVFGLNKARVAFHSTLFQQHYSFVCNGCTHTNLELLFRVGVGVVVHTPYCAFVSEGHWPQVLPGALLLKVLWEDFLLHSLITGQSAPAIYSWLIRW